MSLRNRIVRFPHLFGLRVMRLDNCPLGTAPKLYQDVRQCLKKFDIDRTAVLDVGAHRGEVTQDLLATFPSVRVHAFEPSPSMFNLLRRRFLGNTRVRCHQLAISSSSGELLFEPRPEEPGLARLTEQRSPSTIVVNSTTLDEFITSQSIEIVPLLKTDTEGNETQVLLGAVNALKNGRIFSVLVECAPGEGSFRHQSLASIQALLYPLGFEVVGPNGATV